MRLILFDIDGTLVSGGPAKEAFHVALVDAFGTAGDIEVHEFSGKTDPQIARELLTGAGLTAEQVDEGLPRLWERYLGELEARLPETPVDVLAGVPELLDELGRREEHAGLGLVTGNVAGGARLKLGSAGLHEHFRIGGYGSDHEERNRLPAIAIERAEAAYGRTFEGDGVVVVGDTPRDVACGLHAGCRTVAVATGNFGTDELGRAGAHVVLEDFGDLGRVVEALLE